MLLGDVIARLEDETFAIETLAHLDDLGLMAEMKKRAESAGLSLGAYATWSVRHFADTAPDDEWVQLIGVLGRAEDPGVACLKRAFAYTLATME
jgi:hypothetical protein